MITAMRDKSHIHSVGRALTVLEIVGASPHPVSLTEVANRAGLTRTTSQRFINTLAALGYLNRDEAKRYTLATRVLSLGFQFLNTSSLLSMARPYLDELSAGLRMTVNLAVLDDTDVLVLYRREVRNFLKFDVHAGSKLLAYGSALGRVLLAALCDSDLERRLAAMNIQKLTEKTIVSIPANMAEIARVRQDGYALSDREQTMDLCSIAVPLNDGGEKTVAAVNVSIDGMKLGDPDTVDRARRELVERGRVISANLGYKGPYPKICAADRP